MKSVNTTLQTAIRSAYNLQARPRLTVEWNLNRYFDVTSDNVPPETDYGYDIELYPIEDIVKPNRPTKGVAKARVGQSVVANNDPTKQPVRFYGVSVDDPYKYWCSPVPTDASGNFPTWTTTIASNYSDTINAPDNGSMVRPYITYSKLLTANKIVVKTENSFASPNSYEVFYQKTVGGAWFTTGITSGLNTRTGQLSLWWNGNAWTTTRPTGVLQTTKVAGVMFRVSSMTSGYDLNGAVTGFTNSQFATNPTGKEYILSGSTYNTTGANSYLELIEIAACLESDLTSKLISVGDDFDMAEKSNIYPIGTVTGNTANITLSNLYTDVEIGAGTGTATKTGLFSNDNTASPYYGIVEPNAVFNLEYVFTINGVDYPVQQFNMYGGAWVSSSEDQVSIDLRDYSKFFDEDTPPPIFWMGKSVTEIIWRLCDILGFVNYSVGIIDTDQVPIVNYWWTDGTKTMWEICEELSRATQTAIYFDGWGSLQIRGRDHAFNTAASSVWTLRNKNVAGDLADIISLESTGETATNATNITYHTSDMTMWDKNIPKLTRVWEPDGAVALHGAILRKSLGTSDTSFVISGTEAALWPYTGICQIEGEIIKWDAKEYQYTDTANTLQRVWVKSQEELTKYKNLTKISLQYASTFTGRMRVAERGVWNSEVKAHQVEALGYSVRNIIGGVGHSNVGGFKHQPNQSTVRLTAGNKFKSSNDLLVATRGNPTDTPFWYFGTRLKFKNTGRGDQRAGIVINSNGGNENGYYIELQPSSKVNRAARNEVIVFSRTGGNTTLGGKGKNTFIAQEQWIDVDVSYSTQGSGGYLLISINGNPSFKVNVPAAQVNPAGGRFGMFFRGDTDVEFEYLYAVTKPPGNKIDQTSWWDGRNGGYLSQQWDTEWVFDWRNTTRRERKKSRRKQKRWNRMYMDEFGPWVHEIREFNVEFEPAPVADTRLLFNSRQAVCLEYHSSSFGANFVLANTARRNVIINGDDAGEYSGWGEVSNNVLMIYGRTVDVKEGQRVTRQNDTQIKLRGRVETEVDSNWIQSEAAANSLGDWINTHWSVGADELTVTIFGNPLLEIGDLVSIDFAERFMTTTTHKYFVLGVKTDWDAGIETTLTLRRKT